MNGYDLVRKYWCCS